MDYLNLQITLKYNVFDCKEMKADELMTKDLVLYKRNIVRIVTIDGGTDTVWIDSEDYSGLVKTEMIQPISLTVEMLKKNGFIEDEENDWFTNSKLLNKYCIIIQFCRELDGDDIVEGSFLVFNGCPCRYAHELQHALRLCGLSELSDNFKI